MTLNKEFWGESVEGSLVAWFRQQRGAPGLELHADRGVIWIVHPGVAWGNAAAGLRLGEENIDRCLDQMIGRYRENGRGAGFWLSALATPASLREALARRGFRCRKHFPGMFCDLSRRQALPPLPAGMAIVPVEDHSIFRRTPHPYFGHITTPIRRFELARLAHLASQRPRRVWEFAATLAGVPVGVGTICLGPRVAGVFDVGVLPDHRGRGIGTALVGHLCAFARERGMSGATLIATGMGEGVYRRAGFEEVCKMSYWYSSLGKHRFRSLRRWRV
ncbi:MAG: GNAT family N-acetyltransferase [Verrucomicrobia bacterium]|nr:GNAT family N-acetyltransferase [Verrucomicrobiota bacterium]